MTPPLKVLIVDDHRMFREGIRSRLASEADIKVVGEAASAEEALDQVRTTKPSLVVLDVRLPDMSGIELARQLRQEWPSLKILMLTGYDFDQYVRAAARVGVEGYLLKDSPQDELVHAIREIAGGGAVLPPRIAMKVMRSYSVEPPAAKEAPLGKLTMRELEIVELIHQGLRNADIAQRLSISARTVEAHVSSIMGKFNVQSRTEAVRIAVDMGMIK